MILHFRIGTNGRFAAASIRFQHAPDWADVFGRPSELDIRP
jgi:hypothetical protein